MNDSGKPPVEAVSGAAMAGIVCGLIALMVAFVPVIGVILGGVLSLLGLAAGIVARRATGTGDTAGTDTARQLATAGILTSAIALVFVVVLGTGLVVLTPIDPSDFGERLDSLGNRIAG